MANVIDFAAARKKFEERKRGTRRVDSRKR